MKPEERRTESHVMPTVVVRVSTVTVETEETIAVVLKEVEITEMVEITEASVAIMTINLESTLAKDLLSSPQQNQST